MTSRAVLGACRDRRGAQRHFTTDVICCLPSPFELVGCLASASSCSSLELSAAMSTTSGDSSGAAAVSGSGKGRPSWDEFHALRKRQRSVVERPAAPAPRAPPVDKTAPGVTETKGDSGGTGEGAASGAAGGVSARSAGPGRMAFVVTPGARAIMLAVVTIDFIAAFCRLLALPVPQFAWLGPVLWAVVWWVCFVLSVLELLALFIRAPLALASDTAAMLDMILMGLEGHYGYTMGHPAGHALSLGRVVIRGTVLIQMILAQNAAQRAKLEGQVATQRKRQTTLQALLDQATAKWQRESQTRARTEALMNSYKEQVDMLREALSIAAQEQVLRDELGIMGAAAAAGAGGGAQGADAEGGEEELTAEELAMLEAAAHGPRYVVSADGSYTKLQAPSAIDLAAEALRATAPAHDHGDHDGHDHA